MFSSFELEREGAGEPMGNGAIRVFSTAFTSSREEVTGLDPDRRLTYRLLSGLPLRNYSAEVELGSLEDGGTSIHWCAHFGPQPFGTRLFWRLFMSFVLSRIARDLAYAAARNAHEQSL